MPSDREAELVKLETILEEEGALIAGNELIGAIERALVRHQESGVGFVNMASCTFALTLPALARAYPPDHVQQAIATASIAKDIAALTGMTDLELLTYTTKLVGEVVHGFPATTN